MNASYYYNRWLLGFLTETEDIMQVYSLLNINELVASISDTMHLFLQQHRPKLFIWLEKLFINNNIHIYNNSTLQQIINL